MRAFLLLTCCLLAGGGLLLWTRDAPRVRSDAPARTPACSRRLRRPPPLPPTRRHLRSLPQGLPHPNLYGVPPPLPPRLRWHAWLLQPWQRWRRWGSAWAPGPPPPPPLPPLPPLRNQGLVGVAYSDPKTGVYLGSPSIARLDADTLLMSHVSQSQLGACTHLVSSLPFCTRVNPVRRHKGKPCQAGLWPAVNRQELPPQTTQYRTCRCRLHCKHNGGLHATCGSLHAFGRRTISRSGAAASAPRSTLPRMAVPGASAPPCRPSFGPLCLCTKAGWGARGELVAVVKRRAC